MGKYHSFWQRFDTAFRAAMDEYAVAWNTLQGAHWEELSHDAVENY